MLPNSYWSDETLSSYRTCLRISELSSGCAGLATISRLTLSRRSDISHFDNSFLQPSFSRENDFSSFILGDHRLSQMINHTTYSLPTILLPSYIQSLPDQYIMDKWSLGLTTALCTYSVPAPTCNTTGKPEAPSRSAFHSHLCLA